MEKCNTGHITHRVQIDLQTYMPNTTTVEKTAFFNSKLNVHLVQAIASFLLVIFFQFNYLMRSEYTKESWHPQYLLAPYTLAGRSLGAVNTALYFQLISSPTRRFVSRSICFNVYNGIGVVDPFSKQ